MHVVPRKLFEINLLNHLDGETE